ncbi:hypothetical protein RI367_003353 [Sorochytrium milnesiophthora]
MAGAGIFLFAVVMAAVLLFAMVFFIIMFSDLECDYINPVELCNKLNQFVMPEYIAHGVLSGAFLLSGNWLALLLNAPLLVYHVKKSAAFRLRDLDTQGLMRASVRRIVDRRYLYDATEIFQTLQAHKRESLIKLGFYLLCFFYYLYRMIVGLINSN